MRAIGSIFATLCIWMSGTLAVMAAQPENWAIWYQPPGSEMQAKIEWFGAYTLWFIIPITIFVMVLLLYVMLRFNKRVNPEPSKTSHNTMIEVVWTVAPILILIAIAIPSFELLDEQLAPEEEPAMTIKATGYQWYWNYEYQDGEEVSFDSLILSEEDREDYGKADKSEYPRLLAVDNEIVVPVGEMVRMIVTAEADGVIHSWAMPSFGAKVDAVPGRINETWFKAENEGIYYGQCSELCGKDHAFMPIAVRAVSKDKYDAWQKAAADDVEAANKALMASIDTDNNFKLAQNQPAQ